MQMGRHPVAVVILHIAYARTMKVDYSGFSLGGLHGKHVVAAWKRKTGTIPAFAHSSNMMKIRSVEAEFFLADGRSDITKLTVSSRIPRTRPKFVVT
jgi:hypothetical protein